MDPFELPETLPSDPDGLSELRDQAGAWFEHLRSLAEGNGEGFGDDELSALRQVVDDIAALDGAINDYAEAEEARSTEAADLIGRVVPAPEDPAEDPTDPAENPGDPTAEEAPALEPDDILEPVTAGAPARNGATRPTRFTRPGGGRAPARQLIPDDELGWQMDPGAFGYRPGVRSFQDIAEAIDSIRPNSRARTNRPAPQGMGSFVAQSIARLSRRLDIVDTPRELTAAIIAATDESTLPGGSLTAAGGWCAPSEQLYDFCAVPQATDLLSLPEITIRRGGVRWPVEPDLSEIFENFEWFFTETQLEAEDEDGNPTAVKTCVSVPCPDEFEELRLAAVGYCVEVGILQEQGWPELIAWFMQSLMQEHFRALSRRTINDIVLASGAPVAVGDANVIGTTSAILNSIEFAAVNIRLSKGLGRSATIEGIAPSWLHSIIRSDLAMERGVDTKAVTDAQITAWFTARNISLQFVGDWQTRETGFPGNLTTGWWPATVDIVLYPAGTWFRALSNVVEFGAMYPRELLQVNRYTKFFTEDAIAVGKRCNNSIVVRVPVCVSGAYGGPVTIACETP